MLLKILGKPETLLTHVADRLGHDRRYAVDCTKLKEQLGWKREIPFEEGLRDTVAWYQRNSKWVEHAKSGEYLKFYERQYGTSA